MPWESRGDNRYYYRKRREGRRVLSEYLAPGATACTVMRDFPSIDWTSERALIDKSQSVAWDAP